jgi:hypothetical protein
MSADERHREMPTRAPHINRKGHCSDRDNGGGTPAGPGGQVPGVPHLQPGGSGAGSARPPFRGDVLPTVPQAKVEPVGHKTAAGPPRGNLVAPGPRRERGDPDAGGTTPRSEDLAPLARALVSLALEIRDGLEVGGPQRSHGRRWKGGGRCVL